MQPPKTLHIQEHVHVNGRAYFSPEMDDRSDRPVAPAIIGFWPSGKRKKISTDLKFFHQCGTDGFQFRLIGLPHSH